MPPSTLVRLALCTMMFLSTAAAAPTALALTPSSASLTPTQSPTHGDRDSTREILRRLGGRPCPDSDFTCVTLDVPLDHFNPADRRTLPVVFGVLPARDRERKGMFVTATGGPGTAGLLLADSYTQAFDPSLARNFDIVFFDQRGVGLSGGITCPAAAAAYYQVDARADTPEREAAVKSAADRFARDCAAEMNAGASRLLPYLGTDQAVEDLEFFRRIMQDESFWLYGESYGTQYAQTYAAAHGERLAGLILDGTVDLTLNGFEFYAQQTQAFNDTLAAALEVCDETPDCAADMGREAVAAYDLLAAQLKREPIGFHYPLPSGGMARREFTLINLEVAAVGQMYSEGDRMLFQRAMAAAAGRSDLVPLARLLYLTLGLNPESLEVEPDPSFSDAMFYGVECQDYGYPGAAPNVRAENYVRAGDAVDASAPRLNYLFYADLPCAFWPSATTDLTRPGPLVAEGIPTLVLGATADPATPVGNGIAVFQRLADGYLVTQQGGPHVIFGRGNACPDDLVTAFLVEGQVPDQRELECEGVVVDDYVPLAPRSARDFDSLLEALASAETEINYLPEYYYWDGAAPQAAGCADRGTLRFEPDGERTRFTLNRCAFSRGFVISGAGSYHPGSDRFVLDVTTSGPGRERCELRYVRHGDRTRVSGRCDGRQVLQRSP